MKLICDILDKESINYEWYVLGTAFKQEVMDKIQGWFKENSNVHFIGYRDNVYPYISKMNYLALLTDRESWGLVISEALILGIPCIVTNFDGVDKQIRDGENGIIIEMKNIDGNYERKVKEAFLLKDILRENVKNKDYNRERIIKEWVNILSE